MKARNIILTLTAATLLAAPALVSAQAGPGDCDGTGPHGPGMMGGPGGPGGGHGGHGLLRMLPRLIDRLDLSDAQRSQVQGILDAEIPAIHDLMRQAAAARQDFRDSHDPGDFNETEYRTFFEAQSRIHIDAQVAGARAVDQVWDVLTPEQQQQLLDLLELVGPGRGAGKRFGGGRRGGQP